MHTRTRTVYDLQQQQGTFARPEELLQALGLYSLTQQDLLEWRRNTFGETIDTWATEMWHAVNLVNYNQRDGLNAFAGFVSLLPAVDGQVFSLVGGNAQLPQRLLERANVTLALGAAVEEVARTKDGRFMLTSTSGSGSKEQHGPFDAVVVATPLEQAGLSFTGLSLPVIPNRAFQVWRGVHGCVGCMQWPRCLVHPHPCPAPVADRPPSQRWSGALCGLPFLATKICSTHTCSRRLPGLMSPGRACRVCTSTPVLTAAWMCGSCFLQSRWLTRCWRCILTALLKCSSQRAGQPTHGAPADGGCCWDSM